MGLLKGAYRLWNLGKVGKDIVNGEKIVNAIGSGIKREINPDIGQKITDVATETPELTHNILGMLGEPQPIEQQGNADSKDQIFKNEELNTLIEYLDKLQAHQEEREDTAVQRKIKDMLAAGINPNISGDISGAGSTDNRISAISEAFSGITREEMDNLIQKSLNAINNNVKIDENQKDRITDILRTLAMIVLLKK